VGWAIERGLRSRGRLATLVGRHTDLHLPAQHNVEAPVVDALGAAEASVARLASLLGLAAGHVGSKPRTLTLIPTLHRTLTRFVLHVDLSDTAHDCTMKCAVPMPQHTATHAQQPSTQTGCASATARSHVCKHTAPHLGRW